MFRDPTNGLTISERWHIPDIAFALGDDIIVAIANQILALPLLILMSRLCPVGAEGTTYALVTSVQMVGGTVGGILSRNATAAFRVTNTNFTALWQLTIVTCAARLASLLLLPLVPPTAAVAGRQAAEGRRSASAGCFVISLFVGGLGWALAQVGMSLGARVSVSM